MAEAQFTYYNAEKDITLKEYGRNIQNLVNNIVATEDRDMRNRLAKTAVELMRQLNPNLTDGSAQDYTHKLWDDLFIISDFQLDVDSPFPKPDAEVLNKRPERMAYNTGRIKYKHYGRSIEAMIAKAKAIEDEAEREVASIAIGRLMKMFYKIWNKENIEDIVILDQLVEMSNGALTLSLEQVQKGRLFDTEKQKFASNSYATRTPQQNANQQNRTKYLANAGTRKPNYADNRKKK